MAQQMMWSAWESLYRGQGSDGTVITVDEDAMNTALKQAGKGIFDSDWWLETLARVLEHWGIFSKRWTDDATHMPRMHFRLGQPKPEDPFEAQLANTGPLNARILTRKREGQ